jgi:pimeloyl-ACP methyl ester carboxylesterase
MLTEKTFTVDGFSMNYAEGPQAGTPLVFLHGATTWWRDIEPLIQSLMQNWHIYACDMRGHGKSSRTPGNYRAVDFSPDIVAFVQEQIREPVVLIGHSNGGTLALLSAAQIPELVRAIILLDPAVFYRNAILLSTLTDEWFVAVADVLNSTRTAKEAISPLFPGVDETVVQGIESMIRIVDPEFVSVMLNNQFFDGLDLEQVADKVKCPTLHLYGELDLGLGGVVRESDVEFLKQHIPQIITHQIKGAGHSPHWEQTETTLGHITDFLKTI